MRGFIIGRFQPFHKGHQSLIERATAQVDELIIGIGSADKSHSVRNPFTGGERVQMIQNFLSSNDTSAYPVPVRDVNRNDRWVRHVTSMCPHFDVVYTNNALVKRLFREDGFDIRGTPVYDREQHRGSEIRRRMIANEDWSQLVPRPVRTVIDDIDGAKRLREISVYANSPTKNTA